MSSYQRLNTVAVLLQDVALDLLKCDKFERAEDVIMLMQAVHYFKVREYPETHAKFMRDIFNGS